MKPMKYVLQLAVLLFYFVVPAMVLLYSYRLYICGYQELGSRIEHPSVDIIVQEWEKETEK